MNKNLKPANKARIYLLLSMAAILVFSWQERHSVAARNTNFVDSNIVREAAMSSTQDRLTVQNASPVYLNHFFIVLDSETYNEIKESRFLQDEFAAFEARTTVRTDITYTGIYFYGTHTYFEFFAPGGYNRSEGSGGIASGVEAPGASDTLKQRLESHTKAPGFKNTVTRRFIEKDVPWFYMTSVNYNAPAKLSTWLMEYHEGFLGNWHPELSPKTRGITREEVLERYVAKIGESEKRKSKYLEDIVEMTLALDETEKASFIKEREAFGYKITGSENKAICEGPAIKYTVISSPSSPNKIVEFKMSLKRDKSGQKVYRFGKRSVLTFNGDRTASWSF
jgi:Family of unknown function (DUF5829)